MTGWKPSTSSPSPPACAKASSSGCDGADVNLAAGALHLVKRLKTRSSRRQVLLVSVPVDALGRHLVRQREEWLLLGLGWDDHGLVFPNTVGKPLHPS